jgi:hypothetical protein
MEATGSSGTLIPFYKTVRHPIPEGSNFDAAVSISHLTIKLPYTVSYSEDGGDRFLCTKLHGVTFQKIVILMTTSVKTSSLNVLID